MMMRKKDLVPKDDAKVKELSDPKDIYDDKNLDPDLGIPKATHFCMNSSVMNNQPNFNDD